MKRRILKCISTIEEYVDINMELEIQDFTEPNITEEEIKNTVFKYKDFQKKFKNIKSMHGPFLDLKPSSPDLEIRKVSYNRYLRALNIAKELELDYIIFHSQINPYLNEPFLKELNNKQNKEFWDSIIKQAEYKGTILIENIFEETPLMLKELIETINLPNIRVNLDVGHANLGKATLEQWISGLKDYIDYIHLHSNNGIYDQHKSPTKNGIKNLIGLLDKYNINPVISLEYKSENLERDIKLIQSYCS